MSSLASAAPDGFLFARFGHRALALAVDCLPALVVGYLALRWGQGLGEGGAVVLAAVLVLVLWLANRVVGVAVTGRSLGKALTGLTVVPLADVDGRVGMGRAFGREALTLAYLIPAAGAVGVFLA